MESLTTGAGDEVTEVKGLISERPDSLFEFVMLPEVTRGGRTITVLFRQLGHVTFFNKKNYLTSVDHISSTREQNSSERASLDLEKFTQGDLH